MSIKENQPSDILLSEIVPFLQNFTSETEQKSLLTKDDLGPLLRALEEDSYFSAAIPRLALIGQFKAGKSTLINAILGGRQFAASDILEMTSWIARYWPAKEHFCRISYQNGTEQTCSPESFYERCQTRQFTNEELRQIKRVDIGLERMPLEVTWIDCPGLGSVNRENEKRMIEALEEADVILWVIDCEATGNLADLQLIRHYLSRGMPCLIIITKTDLEDDPDELEEICDDLACETELPREHIFLTAALRDPASKESGIPQLLSSLGSLPYQANAIRAKAETAHKQQLLEQVRHLLQLVRQELTEAQIALSRYSELLQVMKKSIEFRLIQEAANYTKENLLSEHKSNIISALSQLIQQPKQQVEVTQVLHRYMDDKYLEQFWTQLVSDLSAKARLYWKEEFSEENKQLQDVSEYLRADVWKRTNFDLPHTELPSLFESGGDFDVAASIQTSLGIAGAASAYVAWLGPLAAKISIGSAVTGVGLPIALIGAGITALLYKMNQKRSPSDSPEQIAQQIFQNYIDEFVDNIIQSHFMNEVRSMQERMAQDLESFFLKRFESYIPTGQTLQSLLLRCEHYLENLPDRDITKYSIAIDIPARSPTHAADHFMTGGAPLSAPYKAQELQTNWILNNRYRIEVKLGEGGMGQVYRCIDLQLPNEPIALKLLRPELAHQDSFRERFLNEINVNRMLTHEGIVRSYDTVYDSSLGLFFFTMEYIDGVTLESLLKERLAGGYEPPFGYQEAAKYLYKLCEVLDYAHKRQVIHRDLKPSNIMVTTEGKVKLMDFGIAKLLGTQKASHTGKIGTFAYMAPEQDQGGEVSEAADIFSLGVLSYQMLTGKFPSGNAPSPSTLGVVLPAKVERMIMSAMEHNIKIRPTLDMIRNALGSN